MKRIILLVLCYLGFVMGGVAQSNKPNIVIIIGDECTYSDLSIYGGTNVSTPFIKALAGDGMVFNKAYVSMAMGVPGRTELYTGLFPANSGVMWDNSNAKEGTESIVGYLNELGYSVGIAGKLNVAPVESVFPFEMIPGIERNCESKTAGFDLDGMREFVAGNKEANIPFCMIASLSVPNAPWSQGSVSSITSYPSYFVDTDDTRTAYKKYLAEIEELDEQVGQTIQLLKDEGVYNDNTIVIFTTGQGAQFPYCKWTNYENGVHTSFIVHWNGTVSAGSTTDALIQYSDVLPTLIDATGEDPASKNFDGTSFLSVLKGETNTHRDYAYFMHNNYPGGAPYPIRSVSDGTYHYIRNLSGSSVFYAEALMGDPANYPFWQTWFSEIIDKDENYSLVADYLRRPGEELYNVTNDKHERTNLTSNVSYDSEQTRLSDALDAWMSGFDGGLGAELDLKAAYEANQAGYSMEYVVDFNIDSDAGTVTPSGAVFTLEEGDSEKRTFPDVALNNYYYQTGWKVGDELLDMSATFGDVESILSSVDATPCSKCVELYATTSQVKYTLEYVDEKFPNNNDEYYGEFTGTSIPTLKECSEYLYVFKGWSESSTGGDIIEELAEIMPLHESKNIVLFAQWEMDETIPFEITVTAGESIMQVCEGDEFELAVDASDDGKRNVVYQWTKDGQFLAEYTSSFYVSNAMAYDTGEYKVAATCIETSKTAEQIFNVSVSLNPRDIIIQNNNTLMVNNDPSANGGYTFTSFEWYDGEGKLVSSTQKLETNNKFDGTETYILHCYTSSGEEYTVCEFSPDTQGQNILVYPTAVSRNEAVTVKDLTPGNNTKIIEVSDVTRRSVRRIETSDTETEIYFSSPGMNFIRVIEEGVEETFKVVVK